MIKGVVYYVHGRKHWAVLTVSLLSLRNHWPGHVCIFYGDEDGRAIAEKLQADEHLGPIVICSINAPVNYKYCGFVNKSLTALVSPFDSTVFLDADTIVAGPIDSLFPTGDHTILTQFSNWQTLGRRISGRVREWQPYAPAEVKIALSKSMPAINTGVLGFTKDSAFSSDWSEVTMRWPSFFCDEMAAQILLARYENKFTVLDDRYNCSPIYGFNKTVATVWHFHGRKHLHEKAKDIWFPYYLEAVRDNIANINDWTPAGDQRLRGVLHGC